jgi:uncharacterized protein
MGSSRAVKVMAGQTVLARAVVAETAWTRMVGLLGRPGLGDGEGLVLRPCSSVHTWFMRFTIDVLFLDRDLVVLRAVDSLRPFRLAWGGWQAALAVELPAGTLRRAAVTRGVPIRFEQL